MIYFWLSFADGSLPVGSQFLGVAVVPADDFISAVMVTHAKKINPGGEVCGYPYIFNSDETPPPDEYVGRLLTKDEANALDERMYELYPGDARPIEASADEEHSPIKRCKIAVRAEVV